jgi:hypothetical protein
MPPDRKTLFRKGPIGTALPALPIILGNLLQTGYQRRVPGRAAGRRRGGRSFGQLSPHLAVIALGRRARDGGRHPFGAVYGRRRVIEAEQTIADEGIL